MALTDIEKTLLDPLVKQIVVSHRYADVLCDNKALELEPKIGGTLMEDANKQDPYALMYPTARTVNFNHYIQKFMSEHQEGTIIILGAGLNTLYYQNRKEGFSFVEVDMPQSLSFRREFFEEAPDDQFVRISSYFHPEWMETVKSKIHGSCLVILNGLSYYFQHADAIKFISSLKALAPFEFVFDCASYKAINNVKNKKQTLFGIDKAENFLSQCEGVSVKVLEEKKYFALIRPNKIKFGARVKMVSSDMYGFIKMEDWYFNQSENN